MNRKERRKRIRQIVKELKNLDKHYPVAKELPPDILDKAYELDNELLELSGKDYLYHIGRR